MTTAAERADAILDDAGVRAQPDDPRQDYETPTPDDETDEELAMRLAYERARAIEVEADKLRIRDEARRKLAREHRAQVERPRPVPLDEFLARHYGDPTYRVAQVWPTGGRVLLAAQAKAGKTTMLGNLIRSLVDDEPFLDRFPVRAGARVALIDNELDERTLQRWLTDQGVQNQHAVSLVPLRGAVGTFDIRDDEVRAEWARDLTGHDVLILDCLRPVLDALDLDENHEVGKFLVPFDALLKESGASESIVTHHMGHSAERERGDSRLRDWPDASWKLVRDKDEDDDQLDDMTGSRYFSAFGRDVDVRQAELTYDHSTRRLALGDTAKTRRETTEHRKIIRADEAVLIAVAAQPGINKTQLRDAVRQRGVKHNPDIDAAVERLVGNGLLDRRVAGRSHFHYPINQATTPHLPNMPNDAPGAMGGYVPSALGRAHNQSTPAHDPAQTTNSGQIQAPCPHGTPGGDQPNPRTHGRPPCPRCATDEDRA